ncbi:MAG: M48 family metallopeptidase [Anaerolineales bacterium]|nr:M48 family metallopeptidase [Anaerolineales bacterium]
MTDYRYPNERLILVVTVLLVLGVIAFTSVATLCGSLLFVAAMLLLALFLNWLHHSALIRQATPVTPQTMPQLDALVRETAAWLSVGNTVTYVAPAPVLNAYTFGLGGPKAIVLYAGLFSIMDRDELQFILGHEMGHVQLGHTWLNSLLGGMAGIPSPFGAAVILYFAFRWWNRACEFSADRAGLLACGNVNKAVSALVKLATGGAARSAVSQQYALAQLEKQDGDNQLGELLSTHPLIATRIQHLCRYAASDEYRRLQARVNQNRSDRV